MKPGIAAVEVRRKRNKLIVQGLGKTGRGQRYIQMSLPMESAKMGALKFKEELTAAVDEILA